MVKISSFEELKKLVIDFFIQKGLYEEVKSEDDVEEDGKGGTKTRKIRFTRGQQFAAKVIKITFGLAVISIIIPGIIEILFRHSYRTRGKMILGNKGAVNHTFAETRYFPKNLDEKLNDVQIGIPTYDSLKGDVALLWNIPNSGSLVQSIMTGCYHLILAAHKGGAAGIDKALKITTVDGHQYVNVDLSIAPGIERASSMGLASSGLADVLVTGHLHYASTLLLDEFHHGVMFALIRHPVEQSISTYRIYALRGKEQGGFEITVEQYYNDRPHEQNWLVRYLTNFRYGEVTDEHLELAREVLRRKCVIGLYERIEESMQRFESMFGWNVDPARISQFETCQSDMIEAAEDRDSSMSSELGDVGQEGDAVWNFFLEKNSYDMNLYEYAKSLYEEQASLYE